MGMSLFEYQVMELREFFNKLEGWVERQKEERMWLMYVNVLTNPFIDKRDKPSSFQHFLNQNEPSQKVTSKEEVKALFGIKDG